MSSDSPISLIITRTIQCNLSSYEYECEYTFQFFECKLQVQLKYLQRGVISRLNYHRPADLTQVKAPQVTEHLYPLSLQVIKLSRACRPHKILQDSNDLIRYAYVNEIHSFVILAR